MLENGSIAMSSIILGVKYKAETRLFPAEQKFMSRLKRGGTNLHSKNFERRSKTTGVFRLYSKDRARRPDLSINTCKT